MRDLSDDECVLSFSFSRLSSYVTSAAVAVLSQANAESLMGERWNAAAKNRRRDDYDKTRGSFALSFLRDLKLLFMAGGLVDL